MDQRVTATEWAFVIVLEQPEPNAVLVPGRPVSGFGWVLAPDPIQSITVYLDDVRLGQATFGLARSDVAETHPDYPASSHSGFLFTVSMPRWPAGTATLRLLVATTGAEHVGLLPVTIEGVAAPAHDTGPLLPLRLELEEASLTAAGMLCIRGWTVGTHEIESVEVLHGARSLGFADTGISRDDVASALPAYPGSPHAGFELRVAVGRGDGAGDPVTVVVTDAGGTSATAALPVKIAPISGQGPATQLSPMLATLEEARVNERGILRVRGWALSLSPIDQIRVYTDTRFLGVAEKAQPREDVGSAHPDYPNAAEPGFLLQQEMPDEPLEGRVIRVVVIAGGGIQRELTSPMAFAPVVRRRAPDPDVHFYCDGVSLTEAGGLSVDGWAVCASGVAKIEIAIGAVKVGQAEIGRDRPDVGNRFANIPTARKAGFQLSTTSAPSGLQGEQIVSIAVQGNAGEERVILQPVLASRVAPDAASRTGGSADAGGIRFYLDSPGIRDGHSIETVRGFFSLNGWAFAPAGISGVEVFVDEQSQGEAFYGIRREDLQSAFPGGEGLLSGFAMLVPPQVMKPGRHALRVVVRDKAGQSEEAAFSIDAEPAAEGPGPWQLRWKVPQAEIDLQLAIMDAAGWRPVWALLLPLIDTGTGNAVPTSPELIEEARATIASLRHQAYPDWRLIVAVDAQTELSSIGEMLLVDLEDLAPRISILPLDPSQGLAALANDDGMVIPLAPGDRLGEDALLEMGVEGAVRGRPDFLYSDDRRVDSADGQTKAFFKPDWSPDLLLSTNYIGRLWAASPALLRRAGVAIGDLLTFGEFDAVLRLTECAADIVHVRKVLGTHTATEPGTREHTALQRAAQRRKIDAQIVAGCLPGIWRFRRHITVAGLVSIIIPSNASRGLIKITIASIRRLTAWPSYEIIILDNIRSTDDPEKLEWKRWMRANADQVIDIDEDFNWSRFNNIGAAAAHGDLLLFLNDDIEVLNDSWLHGLVEHAQRPEVGTVGPQLLYPDGRVQHAGVFLSREVGRHAFRFYPRDEPGPFGLALTQRNVISVTGACMLMRRDVFEELGGFDEAHSVINNDLDFSLRARRSGWLVIYTPYVTLTHHEMVSRSKLKDVYNSDCFEAAWKDLFLTGDPYFHPMLSGDYDDYAIESEPLRQFQVGHPLVAIDNVRRILAVKVDHIGDFIAAFPALRRIKAHFPQAELCVLAAKASLSLVSLEPAIDRAIEFNFFHARSESGRLEVEDDRFLALQTVLDPQRFDIAIDLRRQPDTRKILRYSGARWLAGFDQGYSMNWLDITTEFEGDIARSYKRHHVTDSLVHLVDAVATACGSDRRVIHNPMSSQAARAALEALPGAASLLPDLLARPIVCVHTGAGATNKQWPAASFAGLIDLLVGHEDVNVLIIGGPDEANFADGVMALVRRPARVFSLIGKTGLRDLPAALLVCDLYVGNDSGPKHMAAALGLPTIGIHSGAVDAVEWGPMGAQTLTIRREVTCGPCYIASASDCPRRMACLHGISVGDVYRACQRMLTLRQPVCAC